MEALSIGIDIGSVATKGVLINQDHEILEKVLLPTGWSPKKTGEEVYRRILEKKGLLPDSGLEPRSSIHPPVVVTGYGRVVTDFAWKAVTEITCHGKGAQILHPRTGTVIDIGGQDSKIIHLSKTGKVLDFLMNDKCAAGTGKFMEVMSTSLGVEVRDLSALAEGYEPCKINNMCTVFAESEVISLLAEGAKKGEIARGIIHSTAQKASVMLRRMGLQEEVLLTGGVSQSPLFRKALAEELNTPVYHREESQFVGALGAAAIGLDING
ncbi:acyl-CoA dehydratase activase [Isachenkonia alkalipeptolytica]|uniref:2-hydroxyglutaryl-CoA dehydratase n=1 Tax=Isachenkonia alkalipeptolytica TaxID=2565777 RepID=A0AA43XNG5_9CLOT|nr:acyl-CoA dehydratase activase [Isachenkonia alkalipeptolytica]NBG89409.1 2-hydroxyglutaryl-CoA dehydratase [Isachenkonia alkalipeptolytica]